MRAGRISATIAVASMLAAACGSGANDAPVAAPPVPATQAQESQPAQSPTASDSKDDPELPLIDDVPTDDGVAGEGSADGSLDESAAVEPTSLPEPASEPADDDPTMAWPDDGCSADNSPMPAAAADGPSPLIEVRAESIDSPLPDLAVRRINCNGGWVNLRNELPSDQPLLVWFWAPH